MNLTFYESMARIECYCGNEYENLKFERDKYGMNGCENLMICHFEIGCLEGYTCAPPLDPQTFSLYRTNRIAQRIT
jgi:hypothetical protein